MLDAATKRKIDSARDILVGKIPDPKQQVDQITTALIYKFMDDMDKESQELGGKAVFFTGDYERYSWPKLLDKRLSGVERLELYAQAITNMSKNPHIPQLFRDIFKGAFLPYREPQTLTLFLKEINGFTYEHSENLGNAYEYLLSVLGSQGKAGQFRTPRHIIDFIVDVVDPKKNETVLDPACGTAGFLISSFKHIIKQNSSGYKKEPPKEIITAGPTAQETVVEGVQRYSGDLLTPAQRKKLANNFTGYDISPDMVKLSLVNMYLHEFTGPRVLEYDTLTFEDHWDESFDVILANPPFMTPKGGIRPHNRFRIQAKRSEVLFVDYIAEHLSINGHGGVVVPVGIIFRPDNAYKHLRKILVDEGCLWAVVSLPSGVFNPYSSVKTSVLFFDKQLAKKSDEILFVKITNDGFDLGAQRRKIEKDDLPAALEILRNWKSSLTVPESTRESIALAVKKSKIAASGDYNLTGDRYNAPVDYSKVKWPMVNLGEICELETGSRQKGGALNKGIPSIGGEQISEYGSIKVEKMKYISEVHFNKMKKGKLQYGDILLVKDGATTGKSGFYQDEYKSAAVNEHVFILRSRKKILPFFLYKIIRSENFQKVLKRYIKGIIGGVSSEIKNVQIPLPPIEIQEKIVAELDGYRKVIDGARQVVENWKPTIKIDPAWPKVKLGDECSFMTGGTPTSTSKEYYQGGTINWLVSGDIHKGEISECKGRITKLGLQNSNARVLPQNSVIIALNGQGKTRGTVAILRIKASCNQSLISIYPLKKDELESEFLLYILRSMYSYLRALTGDQQRSGLNMTLLKRVEIPLPKIEIQKNIVDEIQAEQNAVDECKKLIAIYEQKIKEKIDEVWGE